MIILDEVASEFVEDLSIEDCNEVIEGLSEEEISEFVRDNYPKETLLEEDIDYLKEEIIEQAKQQKAVLQEEEVEKLKEELYNVLGEYISLDDIQIVRVLIEIANDYLYETDKVQF